MRCPKCRNPELDELEFQTDNVKIDRCPTCWGLWFDGGELAQVLRARGQGLVIPQEAQKTDMRCPRCNGDLYSFRYPHSDVTIDMCDICKGAWLDNGEFPRIRAWHQSLTQKELDTLDGKGLAFGDSLDRFLADVQTAIMACPRCAESSLEELPLQYMGVTVDRCVQCGGVWFDGGELERVLEVAAEGLTAPEGAPQSERLCPRCVEHMLTFEYPGTRVKVDLCGKCHGLWLDHGEFRQIRRVRSGEVGKDEAAKEASAKDGRNTVTRFFQKVVSRLGPEKQDK